jgi:tetratricopeptide (TPR) repeat protein
MSFRRLLIFAFILLPVAALAQQTVPPPPQQQPAPDNSQEPFVIEKLIYHVRFENDGTGISEATLQIRVQSEAGVQQLGQLVMGYSAANQRIEFGYVRVRKADGSAAIAGPEAVQDLSAPLAREAPMYTDLRQKHVTVPALRPGETLEYNVKTITEKPLAPGQFWFEYGFERNAITLFEQLELDLPGSRVVKIKSKPAFEPRVSDAGGRHVYTWTSANKKRASEDETQPKKKGPQEPESADIQVTTFENWEQVGRWYGALVKERLQSTPALHAKAAELTRGLSTPLEKLQAIYNYVALNFRYVSLSFGAGRYQPHAAEDVLTNQYGDCKDKHTLLAALALEVGIEVDPALIPSQRKVDAEVPSPAHFDHVISVVPLSNEKIWLDTTTEVAPFRLLASSLRNKYALVIPGNAPASLVLTPADPPFTNTQEVVIEGSINDLGKLDARLRYSLRGDGELVFRSAFRRTPQTKWKQLAQLVAANDGLRGEVDEVTPSDPADTKGPFKLEYHITVPGFLDWSSKRVQLAPPVPSMGLPDADENAEAGGDPVDLGSPYDVTVRMKLTLPARYTARAPVAISVARDYAEFRSRYAVEGKVISAERSLRMLARQLPAERGKDYAIFFRRAVRNDESQSFSLESTLAGTPVIPPDAKPDELLLAAATAASSGDFAIAADLLERAVAMDPKSKLAWNMLGGARLGLQQYDQAAAAFRKQAEVNPYDATAYYGLGMALYLQQKFPEAEAALRKQLEVKPLDRAAQSSLGVVLREWGKYAEAVPELEKAISLAPNDENLYVNLGQAYINLNMPEKAISAFDKAVELAPSPAVWNNVAYELSKQGSNLERAQQYAESAVAATSAEARNVALERLRPNDLQHTASLASYWDTLGWIHFRRGSLDRAERYIRAAWLLGYHGEIADHLAQIYEKLGRKQEAMGMYAEALAASRPVPETRGRLAALAGGENKIDGLMKKGPVDLAALKTYALGKLLPAKEAAEAEFFILLGPGPRVEQVKFIRGSEKLRAFGERLRGVQFGQIFPDETPTKLVRRGTLACSEKDGDCKFTLLAADSVTSTD